MSDYSDSGDSWDYQGDPGYSYGSDTPIDLSGYLGQTDPTALLSQYNGGADSWLGLLGQVPQTTYADNPLPDNASGIQGPPVDQSVQAADGQIKNYMEEEAKNPNAHAGTSDTRSTWDRLMAKPETSAAVLAGGLNLIGQLINKTKAVSPVSSAQSAAAQVAAAKAANPYNNFTTAQQASLQRYLNSPVNRTVNAAPANLANAASNGSGEFNWFTKQAEGGRAGQGPMAELGSKAMDMVSPYPDDRSFVERLAALRNALFTAPSPPQYEMNGSGPAALSQMHGGSYGPMAHAYAKGGDVPQGLAAMVQSQGGQPFAGPVQGDDSGQSDLVHVALSPGEYVVDADVVSALGDGNTEAGFKQLDQMRGAIRADKRSAPNGDIPPPAKQPSAYMRGGRT